MIYSFNYMMIGSQSSPGHVTVMHLIFYIYLKLFGVHTQHIRDGNLLIFNCCIYWSRFQTDSLYVYGFIVFSHVDGSYSILKIVNVFNPWCQMRKTTVNIVLQDQTNSVPNFSH